MKTWVSSDFLGVVKHNFFLRKQLCEREVFAPSAPDPSATPWRIVQHEVNPSKGGDPRCDQEGLLCGEQWFK